MKWLLAIFAALAIGFAAWKLCFPERPPITPSLLNQWEDQLYSLERDEVVRLVAPPFSPQRWTRFSLPNRKPGVPWFQQLMIRVSGDQTSLSATPSKGTVDTAFL